MGILLADTAVAVTNWQMNIDQPLTLGGAGMFDVTVITGLTAVIMAELVGEIKERLTRKRKSALKDNNEQEESRE